MLPWLEWTVRRLLARDRQTGQTEIVIALILFVVLLMLSGRRVLVQ